MREFYKVSPTLWGSRKYWSLPDDLCRYMYGYLLTNRHGNSAGCYQLPPGYGCADLKWSVEDYSYRLDIISKAGLIEFDEAENTLRITNWFEFNAPINAKHALGVLDQIKATASPRLKTTAVQELLTAVQRRGFTGDKGLMKGIEIFLEQSRYNITTKTETKREMEIERETETQIETETREEDSRPALRALAVNGALAPQEEAPEKPAEEFPELPDNLNVLNRLLNTPLMRRSQ